MINNFDLLKSILPEVAVDGEFYHLSVIRRKKDHEQLSGRNRARTIVNYYIHCKNDLELLKNDIINISEVTESRAMLNISPKSNKTIFWKMLDNIVSYAKGNVFAHVFSILDSAVGSSIGIKDKRLFLWDIDGDEKLLEKWKTKLLSNGASIVLIVPTKNGYHIHTKPFNYTKMEEWKDTLHKNNGTILYVPKSLD